MRKFGVAAMAAAAVFVSAAAEEPLPKTSSFLFWKPAEQAVGYRSIEKIFPTRVIKRGPVVSTLPSSPRSFDVSYEAHGSRLDTAGYMKATNVSGLIIVKD